jgi:hypothetical protein
MVVGASIRNLAQRLCRKSLGLALRRPVEGGDKLIDDSTSIRPRRDVGGDQALGVDAERGVDAEGGSRAVVQMVKVSLGRFLVG